MARKTSEDLRTADVPSAPEPADIAGNAGLTLRQRKVLDVIRDWLGELEWGSKVRVTVDVDPYSFL